MGVGVARALGAHPMILTGTHQSRLEIGKRLGADEVANVNGEDPVEAVQRITGGKGVEYVLECSGAPNALDQFGPTRLRTISLKTTSFRAASLSLNGSQSR